MIDVDAISLMLYGDNSDLKDWCGCKQHVGQEPVICPRHQEKLKKFMSVASASGSAPGS